jgi:hypothetical protein
MIKKKKRKNGISKFHKISKLNGTLHYCRNDPEEASEGDAEDEETPDDDDENVQEDSPDQE